MRFQIAGKMYNAKHLQALTLRHALQFEQQMAEMGRPMTFSQAMEMAAELGKIEDPRERGAHRDAMWVLAVTIWASRVGQGEELTLAEAIDVPVSEIHFLPDPADHKQAAGPQ